MLLGSLPCTVGEAPDDGEREEEDHVLGHLPRHRHHVRGVVALRSHRQDRGRDQTRSARRALVFLFIFFIRGARPLFLHVSSVQDLHPSAIHSHVHLHQRSVTIQCEIWSCEDRRACGCSLPAEASAGIKECGRMCSETDRDAFFFSHSSEFLDFFQSHRLTLIFKTAVRGAER